MSYRAFKRLLGEYRLERKCRFLFGFFIVLLLTGSFWLYAWQTESLAYDQIKTACRILVNEVVDRQLALTCRPGETRGKDRADRQALEQAMNEFRNQWEHEWPLPVSYKREIIKPNATHSPDIPDHTTLKKIKDFQDNPDLYE
ncbi:MAG: hypothetical protein ACRELF_19325, partial [Gemmataceae bacterium]